MARGHQVTALVRSTPDDWTGPPPRFVNADVTRPHTVADAVQGADALVSGLGHSKGSRPDVLTAGARAVTAAKVPRVVWLGALGTGRSAGAAGVLTQLLLKAIMSGELVDKATADDVLISAGATVFHAGPMTNGSLAHHRSTMALSDYRQRCLLPKPISRTTVAALMLNEAEHPDHATGIAIPLARR